MQEFDTFSSKERIQDNNDQIKLNSANGWDTIVYVGIGLLIIIIIIIIIRFIVKQIKKMRGAFVSYNLNDI